MVLSVVDKGVYLDFKYTPLAMTLVRHGGSQRSKKLYDHGVRFLILT